MADCGVLTFLGFPSWGPLHLMLCARADPHALAQRFRQVEHHLELEPPTSLLAAFVRCHTDLEPLEHPSPPGWLASLEVEYRYLVVCRYGTPRPLRISFWSWCPEAQLWNRSSGPILLDQFLEHHPAKAVADAKAAAQASAPREKRSSPAEATPALAPTASRGHGDRRPERLGNP